MHIKQFSMTCIYYVDGIVTFYKNGKFVHLCQQQLLCYCFVILMMIIKSNKQLKQIYIKIFIIHASLDDGKCLNGKYFRDKSIEVTNVLYVITVGASRPVC
jgi:hypothetical protein